MKKDNTAVSVVISQADVEAMFILVHAMDEIISRPETEDHIVSEYIPHIERVWAIVEEYQNALGRRVKRMRKKVSVLKQQVKEVQ
ncbi:MAG: hypothetical protein Q4A64_02525 [Porphyromonadaceae bacterium]|nr:hypothetical protein [Porphyromonadaceae bacterium]